MTLKLVGAKVVATQIRPSGTAADAGLKTGDIITSIGSLPIKLPADVSQFDDVLTPGDQVEIEYLRKGEAGSTLVAFMRKADPSDLKKPNDSVGGAIDIPAAPTADDQRPLLLPTLTPPEEPGLSDIEELRQVVRRQQQLIDHLQLRLEKLERDDEPVSPVLNAP